MSVNGGCCDVELQGAATFLYTDVIDAEPCPTWCNHDGVSALVHKERTYLGFFHNCVAGLEGKSAAIDGHVDHLGSVKCIVTDMDGVFSPLRGLV